MNKFTKLLASPAIVPQGAAGPHFLAWRDILVRYKQTVIGILYYEDLAKKYLDFMVWSGQTIN